MPGFNRPDFPEVPDNKINIGDHRDGGPLRVTDLYQEIGSLSNEPVLHDQILTPSIVPETMEQKIANAINDFLSTGLEKSKKQTVIEAFAAFVKDGEDSKTALDAFSTKPKTPKEAAGIVEERRKFEAGNVPPKQVVSKEKQLIKAISTYLK